MQTDAAIKTEGLTKRYGAKVAVDSVDLEIPRGVAFGYLGPNGAGKTTLIRMLLGLTRASAGKMWILGHQLPHDRSQALAKVGAIVEEPRFYPYLTGMENLRIAAAVRGPEAAARIEASIERVGLADRSKEKVSGYSLGMRQRLGIARCLLNDPEVLILDEPMNGLDPAGIMEFRLLIRSFVEEGRTVILSSHLLDEVEKTCDAVAIVDKGRVVRQGGLDEFRGRDYAKVTLEVLEPDLARATLSQLAFVKGVEEISAAEWLVSLQPGVRGHQLNSALVGAGVSVERLEPAKATLEDEFLSVTSDMGIR
ncbi:MAG: ABC transporter ATP-binding protein [Actinomycetota bacterium]|nr:ABC transporter ATP-binding protein [Actinomycetota bacterium]